MIFLTLLGSYYLGAATLFLGIPAIIALFYPINGLSITDRLSDSAVVSVPKETTTKKRAAK